MDKDISLIAGMYKLMGEIGSGGGGTVYLAEHTRLNKNVAIKVDKRTLSANTRAVEREVEALKNLSHTYIPQVYDFVRESNMVCTVMDYIRGESFEKPLARGESFAQLDVIRWTRQLLEALNYLHTRPPYGVLHADIKPANIMLTPGGDICLIDFNIALALGEEGAVSVGRSFGYASPEHYGLDYSSKSTERATTMKAPSEEDAATVLCSRATTVVDSAESGLSSGSQNSRGITLDVRSDIYSLGATLYHIISGHRPNRDAKEVEPLHVKSYSDAFVEIIVRAMNPDPARRYQSAAEMLLALDKLHKTDLRYRRYIRNRRAVAIVLSAMLLTSSLATFAGLKRMERAQTNLVLSEYSANALHDGNVPLAIEYALSALPEETNILMPPSSAQAQKALTDALGVYALADGYSATGAIALPSSPFKIILSDDGTYGAAVYAHEAVIFKPNTAEIVAKLPTVSSALADIHFAGDKLVYAANEGVAVYDIEAGAQLWQGAAATHLAVSADKKTIAAVYKDASEAMVYSINGDKLATISFDGKSQRVPQNDFYGNPGDILLALNHDGSLLAACLDDGSLIIYDIPGSDSIPVLQEAAYTHYEGGFNGNYFAFSAMGVGVKSIFAVYDMRSLAQNGQMESEAELSARVDERGIYLASGNVLVQINPLTGEQKELAYTDKPIVSYKHGDSGTIVATSDNLFHIFDVNARLIRSFTSGQAIHFTAISGDFAAVGSRDNQSIRLMRQEDFSDAEYLKYEAAYEHSEARINDSADRLMLFSVNGFCIMDTERRVINKTVLPDSRYITDQQYSSASGNLLVLYRDAIRIYSGRDGKLLFEEKALKSTFYAPFGVNVLDSCGVAKLVNIDTANVIRDIPAIGDFAAICGITVDDAFLDGRKLIGANKTDDGYIFAVSDGVLGTMYDGSGGELFKFKVNGDSEAYFAGGIAVISPIHGTPEAYDINSGKRIQSLEPDCYMTYLHEVGDYLLSRYITTDGEQFGLLLDKDCEVLARLPGLTDVSSNMLLFDYKTGYIRKSPIYSLEELKELAVRRNDGNP